MRDVGKIQTSRESIPSQFSDKIIYVVDVNPKHARRCNIVLDASKATTGTLAGYTTPTDKDFFLIGVSYAWTSNAAADNVQAFISLSTEESNAKSVISLKKETLTAYTTDGFMSFNPPILLKKGSSINLIQSFTVGASTLTAGIVGYTVDNPKA